MTRLCLLLSPLLVIAGCTSISELPQSVSAVNFDSLDAGKTGAFTYEDSMVFANIDKRTAFLAAKEGLMRSGFTLEKADFDKGTLFGYHDITAHDWNIVAGVYLKESGSDISVKVIAKTSKDFSLVGNLGDTTSGSWPQMILSGMQSYIARESSITNPAKKNFR
jgi:hypothetical protein